MAKKTAKKAVAKKAIKKAATKSKPVKGAAKKTGAKKISASKKTVAKKVAPKKAIAKKSIAKKTIASTKLKLKKPIAKKIAAKKAPAKPIKAAKKTLTKKTNTVAKKQPKKTVVSKKPAKKIVLKKEAIKKATQKKLAPKKVIAIKHPIKKSVKPLPVKKEIVAKQPHREPIKKQPIENKTIHIIAKPEPRIAEKKEITILKERKTEMIVEGKERRRYSDEELMEFRELIVKKLESSRNELKYLQDQISRKSDIGSDDSDMGFKGLEDGTGTVEREYLNQMASRQIKYITDLERALVRIENKTYGICRETGRLISKERLRAVPHATLSIEAKLGKG